MIFFTWYIVFDDDDCMDLFISKGRWMDTPQAVASISRLFSLLTRLVRHCRRSYSRRRRYFSGIRILGIIPHDIFESIFCGLTCGYRPDDPYDLEDEEEELLE